MTEGRGVLFDDDSAAAVTCAANEVFPTRAPAIGAGEAGETNIAGPVLSTMACIATSCAVAPFAEGPGPIRTPPEGPAKLLRLLTMPAVLARAGYRDAAGTVGKYELRSAPPVVPAALI